MKQNVFTMYCRSECAELHEDKSPLIAVGITLSQITKDEWGHFIDQSKRPIYRGVNREGAPSCDMGIVRPDPEHSGLSVVMENPSDVPIWLNKCGILICREAVVPHVRFRGRAGRFTQPWPLTGNIPEMIFIDYTHSHTG